MVNMISGLSRYEEDFEVKFLKQSEDGLYHWPEVDDIAWVRVEDILGPLDLNKLGPRHHV